MRNADGADPARPARRPVVIYLSDEAREVLKGERALAHEARLPPCLDSELVEQLLLRHASTADAASRNGMPLSQLVDSFKSMRAALKVARLERDRLLNGQGRTSKALLAELQELEHRPIEAGQLALECQRLNNTAPDHLFARLAEDLRALVLHEKHDRSLATKVRRAIGEHIGRLFSPQRQ